MVKELTQVLTKELVVEESQLILYNDDYNTFPHVIESLMNVCEHSSTQAEQCAMIVHHKGKYAVLAGEKSDLLVRCDALLDRGLSAEVY